MEDEKQEAVNRTRTFEVMTQGLTAYCIKNKLFILVNYVEGRKCLLADSAFCSFMFKTLLLKKQ